MAKEILAKPIQLAAQVIKAADEASIFKQERAELKSKTEKLAALLCAASRARSALYERPTRWISDNTAEVLEKALSLILKCKGNGVVRRVLIIIPSSAFSRMSSLLEYSIGDVSWLLWISSPDYRHTVSPNAPRIATINPTLCLIWEQIEILYEGSVEDRTSAAAYLVTLAGDRDRYGKLIIEEGGVPPLLKLVKEGNLEGQENAATAIGLLGRDPESAEQLVVAGVCPVFAKMLKEGPMKVQAEVAWAVSVLARNYPKCREIFMQNNVLRFLVGHLAFETIPEDSQYTVVINKATSVLTVVNSKQKEKEKTMDDGADNGGKGSNNGVKQSYSISGIGVKGRELEDPITKDEMKAMAAGALWQLAKGNAPICKSIAESRALLCFAVLLQKSADKVRYNSAMALMEITAVAERNSDLRRSAFKPNSPDCMALIDQLLKIIENEDSNLLIPCIKAIGNIARTFRTAQTRIITPLVKFLDDEVSDYLKDEVSMEAIIALTKFAGSENYLHTDHSKAILSAGGARHLIQIVYFGQQNFQLSALRLLCYISLHVPDSNELYQRYVPTVLEWASKQGFINHDQTLESLLDNAIWKLEQAKSICQLPM